MAGGDNRYPYLRETVRVSQPCFTTIRIVDTGSTDETASLAAHPSVHFERILGWDDDWPRAYLQVINGIPENDWFLFVDSDERPSQLLLDHLQHDIAVLRPTRVQYRPAAVSAAYGLAGGAVRKRRSSSTS